LNEIDRFALKTNEENKSKTKQEKQKMKKDATFKWDAKISLISTQIQQISSNPMLRMG